MSKPDNQRGPSQPPDSSTMMDRAGTEVSGRSPEAGGEPEPTCQVGIIDLDQKPPELDPPPPAARRRHGIWQWLTAPRVGVLPALAILLLAGAATHQWDVRQQRLAQESAVSVLVMVAVSDNESSGSDGRTVSPDVQPLLDRKNDRPVPETSRGHN